MKLEHEISWLCKESWLIFLRVDLADKANITDLARNVDASPMLFSKPCNGLYHHKDLVLKVLTDHSN